MKHLLHKRLLYMASLAIVCSMASGCASVPYKFGKAQDWSKVQMLSPGEPQIEVGRPILALDAFANLFSIHTKILLLNYKVDDHFVGEETIEALRQYLKDNEMSQVKIRINQYSPGGEWKRLFRNKSMGAGWRYTVGIVSALYYTILPGRLLGGDNYNPYTDTVNIYSDVKAIALHEGGHAKDFAGRKYKGTYAAIGALPLVSLYQEGKATGDAIGYLRARQDTEQEKAAYKVLYPAYCTYIASETSNFWREPSGYLLTLGAVIPGHIAGWIKASTVEDRPAVVQPAPAPQAKE